MIDLLSNFSDIITANIFLALLLALLAGFISSFAPCVLTSIPLVVAYVGGYADGDKKKAFIYSLAFVGGRTIIFITLGILSALLGKMLTIFGPWWYLFLGVIMLVIGLQMLGIINILPTKRPLISSRKGILGAFLIGLVGGFLEAPCATPVLIAILVFVAELGDIFTGILLLLFYSIGHSILVLIAGSSVALTQKIVASSTTKKIGEGLKVVLGILIIIVGLYLFYLGI